MIYDHMLEKEANRSERLVASQIFDAAETHDDDTAEDTRAARGNKKTRRAK